jgi:hypothetical protein
MFSALKAARDCGRWKGDSMTVQDGLAIQVPQPALPFNPKGTCARTGRSSRRSR